MWSRFGGESVVTGYYSRHAGECLEVSGRGFTVRQREVECLYMVDDFGQRWVVAPAPTAAHSTTERHVSNDANQDDDGAVPDYADEFSNIDKPVESDSVNGDDAGRENGDLRYGQFRNTMRELCAAWHVTSGLEMENGMSLDNQDAVFPQFSSRGSDNTTISLETRWISSSAECCT